MSAANRRCSVTARRRSGGSGARRLGAVKLQSPVDDAASEAGSPMSTSEPTSVQSTTYVHSPLVSRDLPGNAAPDPQAAASIIVEFSRHLAASHSADKWLEEEERQSASMVRQGSSQAPRQGVSPSAPSQHTESASTQIVHKALGFITDKARTPLAHGPADTKPGFDSQTFLDKGMDAISGVGKLMEGFAITLDTVIGQAFEDWGTTAQPKHAGKPARWPPAAASHLGAHAAAGQGRALAPRSTNPAAGTTASGVVTRCHPASTSKENAEEAAKGSGPSPCGPAPSRQPHITSFMSKLDAASQEEVVEWRRRAQQLAGELQRVRAQQEEYQRLRLQYDKLETELHQASTVASRLAQENCALKSHGPEGGVVDPALGGADPLAAQQVARQMEALLVEKSKLVQENDRLLRENTGLQELLEFTVQHHAQLASDGELFGSDDDEEDMLEASGALLASPLGQPEADIDAACRLGTAAPIAGISLPLDVPAA